MKENALMMSRSSGDGLSSFIVIGEKYQDALKARRDLLNSPLVGSNLARKTETCNSLISRYASRASIPSPS